MHMFVEASKKTKGILQHKVNNIINTIIFYEDEIWARA
jgi:hypothetical protein